MTKSITVLTATRAEYGLLKPLIGQLLKCPDLETRVVVTGAHLSPEFGLTYSEIESDGIAIDRKIEILLSSDTPAAISKSMGVAMISFADYWADRPTDAVLVLGDRYETLAVAMTAMNARIPIFHLYGGETTEGAVDEAIRHAITKLSYLHFTSTEAYRRRVIQLGEAPSRVFTVGALGVENAMNVTQLSREELAAEIGVDLSGDYAMLTFHPVTLEADSAAEQMKQLLQALENMPGIMFLITKANADAGGRIINHLIDEYVETHENVAAFESLGQVRYLNAIRHCTFVIGNSSSGLIEVPSFAKPTIDIGDRQKGRLAAGSVIHCEPDTGAIIEAVRQAMSESFRKNLAHVTNPYGDGHTSGRIRDVICGQLFKQKIELKKSFFDVDFSHEDKSSIEDM